MDEKADPTDVPRLPGPSVLVVEDEFLIALELEILLAGNGWNVIGPASSVREALFLLQDARPDAAILDVKLADGPVTVLAERMRRLDVPFVLSTGVDPNAASMPDIIARSRVVQKPVEWERLRVALKEVAPRADASASAARL